MTGYDIGIDLGTTKIIIYRNRVGEILREPAVVAVNLKDNSVMAVGDEALKMLGKTPEYIVAEYPLKDGVIADHNLTEVLIKDSIKKVCDSFLFKNRVVICVPSSITDVEKRAVKEVLIGAGCRKVFVIEEPVAAAIGAGIDISKANGNLVVDIGGGTSDVAVISMSGVVCSKSIKVAGNKIDDDIIKYFALTNKLSIGKRMAEKIKIDIACVFKPSRNITATVKGRNLLTGYPQKIEVSQLDLYDTVIAFANEIVAAIKYVLDKTPPELSSDIYSNGIILTGGGALLAGLDEYIQSMVGFKVKIADSPIECVSIGTGKAFDYIDTLQNGFSKESVCDY
ncbi:MAG: rod shape-determining protein [Oscillospiraceae bacterium]